MPDPSSGGALLELPCDTYEKFLTNLREDRKRSEEQLRKDVNWVSQGRESDLFRDTSEKFLSRKKALQVCLQHINESIKEKEEVLRGKDSDSLSEGDRLVQMDLEYQEMFKRLVQAELVKEETLKKRSLEIFMSKFVNTVIEAETPETEHRSDQLHDYNTI